MIRFRIHRDVCQLIQRPRCPQPLIATLSSRSRASISCTHYYQLSHHIYYYYYHQLGRRDRWQLAGRFWSNYLILTNFTQFRFAVVLDGTGFSKGYGFIRFGNEQEQQTSLISMMGIAGLGGKPIKVREYFCHISTPCVNLGFLDSLRTDLADI